MNIIKNITNPLERRRIQFGYSQHAISKLLGITQSQYSRIEKGTSNPNKHLKKLSEIFKCDDPTNNFQRVFHERKPGYVNLKIEGWFTKKQIMHHYEMLLKELNKWNVNEDGIRWKYK